MTKRIEKLKSVACPPVRTLPRSYTVMTGRGAVKKVETPMVGEVIMSPSAGKLDKMDVFRASMIRNRAVLEALSKH